MKQEVVSVKQININQQKNIKVSVETKKIIGCTDEIFWSQICL